MEMLEALQTLDPNLATHWTGEGLPRVDVVSAIVGRTLTRADISSQAPDFNRATHRAYLEAQEDRPSAPMGGALLMLPPTWLYHSKCPEGRVFAGAEVSARSKDGWVDTPAKLPKVDTPDT
jgi:hypothetical protein